jgi:hypothetical protein
MNRAFRFNELPHRQSRGATVKRLRTANGVVAVFMAIGLLAFLALVALVVDLGYGLSVRTQLHEVADAAALAGASQLNGTLDGITNAQTQAIAYAASNQAAGYPVVVSPADVKFGRWDMPAKSFVEIPIGNPAYPSEVTAVQVTARRDAASGTALATIFARTFGRLSMDVTASAVSQIGGPSRCVDSADPALDCNLDIPVVLCKSQIVLENGSPNCGVNITVGPPGIQSGALTAYYDTANASNIQGYVNGDSPSVYAGSCSSCPSGTQINVTQGTDANVFKTMQNKFISKTNPCLSPSCEMVGGKPVWKTYVAVICADCRIPSTLSPSCVAGFAKMNITEICASGTQCVHTGNKNTKAIYGSLQCDQFSKSPGGTGGAYFGTDSPTPGLVQ